MWAFKGSKIENVHIVDLSTVQTFEPFINLIRLMLILQNPEYPDNTKRSLTLRWPQVTKVPHSVFAPGTTTVQLSMLNVSSAYSSYRNIVKISEFENNNCYIDFKHLLLYSY